MDDLVLVQVVHAKWLVKLKVKLFIDGYFLFFAGNELGICFRMSITMKKWLRAFSVVRFYYFRCRDSGYDIGKRNSGYNLNSVFMNLRRYWGLIRKKNCDLTKGGLFFEIGVKSEPKIEKWLNCSQNDFNDSPCGHLLFSSLTPFLLLIFLFTSGLWDKKSQNWHRKRKKTIFFVSLPLPLPLS